MRPFPEPRAPPLTSPTPDPAPELSRIVDLTAMKPVATMTVTATPAECAALARRMGVEAVERLEATLKLEILPGRERLRVSGRLQAALRQLCVVTLAPLATAVDETFAVVYAGSAEAGDAVAIDAGAGDVDSWDWDEPWPGDSLDVGEAVAQQLALAIDPYPRAPDAAAPPGDDPPQRARPFAGLSALVKDREGRA